MRFARITLGLDGSPHAEAALSHAIRIARATKGLVRGIHVVDRSMLDGVVVADLSGSVGFQPFLFEGVLHEVGEPATERVLPPPLTAAPDMARLIPIGKRNGIEILGPPGPPPGH